MLAQLQQPWSPNPIGVPVARSGQPAAEAEKQQLWEGRLSSLQQCLSELLLENQRLRMHLRLTPLQPGGVLSADHGEI